eukprot:910459-Pyramimonas_sp.AAC.1
MIGSANQYFALMLALCNMTPLVLLLPRPNLRNKQARVALALAAVIRVLAVLLLRLEPVVQSMPRS